MVVYGRVFGVCTSVGSCTRVPKVGALQQAKFCSSDPCFTVLFASLFVQQDLAVRSCSEEISDVGSASRHTKHRIIMPGTRAQSTLSSSIKGPQFASLTSAQQKVFADKAGYVAIDEARQAWAKLTVVQKERAHDDLFSSGVFISILGLMT